MGSPNEASNDESRDPLPHPARRKTPRLQAITIIAGLVILALLFYSRLGHHPPASPPLAPAEEDPPDDKPFKPTLRYDLSTQNAACWPSTGGVWIKPMSPVELAYLGVDRFHDVERDADPDAEDAFCAKLRGIGADWYELPPKWDPGYTWCEDMYGCVKPDVDNRLQLGFTEDGGVWVLDMRGGYGRYEPGIWGLANCLTMGERCRVIEELGGKFCKSMRDCEETRRLVD